MKVWLIAVALTILGTLAGCGGSSGNSDANNLTQAQARQLGTTVSNDASRALGSALGIPTVPLDISARDNMLAALRRNDSHANALLKPENLICNGSDCTVSGTYNCPDGGSIMVSGTFTANGASTSATMTETPSNCSDGTLVINGNPDVTVALQGNDNGVTTTVNLTMGGGVSFSPVQAGQFPKGSCSLNVTATFSVNDSSGSVTSSSISGSICGQTIN